MVKTCILLHMLCLDSLPKGPRVTLPVLVDQLQMQINSSQNNDPMSHLLQMEPSLKEPCICWHNRVHSAMARDVQTLDNPHMVMRHKIC